MNNNIEIACLLNLLVLFSISLYTASNQIVVTVFVSLAMVQLLFVILWHIKNLIWNNRPAWFCLPGRFTNCFNVFRHQAANKLNHIELVNEVPEVAHNYSEFQEPVIGI